MDRTLSVKMWRLSNPKNGEIVEAEISVDGVKQTVLAMHNGAVWLVQDGSGSFWMTPYRIKRWREPSMEILKFVN